jgi:hypothetical protein
MLVRFGLRLGCVVVRLESRPVSSGACVDDDVRRLGFRASRNLVCLLPRYSGDLLRVSPSLVEPHARPLIGLVQGMPDRCLRRVCRFELGDYAIDLSDVDVDGTALVSADSDRE